MERVEWVKAVTEDHLLCYMSTLDGYVGGGL